MFVISFIIILYSWLNLFLLSPFCLQLIPVISYNLYKWFYLAILPTITILLSSAVMLTSNPIFSLFYLISLFFSVVLLLFSLQIEFLAMIYLIIYIGAISILFLFVIMMFNLKQLQKRKNTFFFGTTIFIYILVLPKFYNLFINNLYMDTIAHSTTKAFWMVNPHSFFIYKKLDILIFSELFYNYYSYLFLLSGMVLLTAMLGSIVLALSTVEISADTDQFKDIFRK